MNNGKVDNALLKKNLRYFAKLFPHYAARLESPDIPDFCQIIEAKNGTPSLIFDVEGKSVAVHSKYDPQKEAHRWAQSLGTEWDTLILYGLGLGYHALEVAKAYPGKKIIVVELNYGLVFQAMSNVDLTELLTSNVSFVIENDPKLSADAAYQESEAAFSKSQIVKVLPPYESAFPAESYAFLRGYNDLLLQFKGNIATRVFFRQRLLVNLRDNAVKYLESPGVNNLYNKFRGVPIIVVAAGPSLEKNIHLLSQCRDKALIIAAGSAIGPLLKNKIIPDLLVSVDPGKGNYQHFNEITSTNIRLVLNGTLYSPIVQEYQGPTFAMGLDTSPFERWLEDQVDRKKGIITSGASVAISTFDLAVRLGGDPIIFIGQDLAYTDFKSHAAGSKHQKSVSKDQEGLFQVDGIDGPVFTNHKFWIMKLHLEKLIRAYSGQRRIINSTEGGVMLENTEVVPLAQVLENLSNLDISIGEMLDQELNLQKELTPSEMESLIQGLDKLDEEVRIIENAYAEVTDLAEKLIESTEKLKESRLEKLDKEIKRWERKAKRTDLFNYFVEPLLREQLGIISKAAAKEIVSAQDVKSRAQAIGAGYLKWLAGVNEYASHAKEEFIDGLRDSLKRQVDYENCN